MDGSVGVRGEENGGDVVTGEGLEEDFTQSDDRLTGKVPFNSKAAPPFQE